MHDAKLSLSVSSPLSPVLLPPGRATPASLHPRSTSRRQLVQPPVGGSYGLGIQPTPVGGWCTRHTPQRQRLLLTPPRLGLRRDLVSYEVTSHPARRHEWQSASPLQCPRRRHDGSRRVQHPALSVSCICRGSSSSRRFRAIQSRPDPVKWSARRITPFDRAGTSPRPADPPDQPARAPGRSGLPAAGRPVPADGPCRATPTKTETNGLPAALPASVPPCRCWSPRP